MLGLASLVCATFAAAMAPSLWLFALLATASFLAVWFLERKLGIAEHTALDGSSVLSLVIYAALASVFLVTVRAALGWLEKPTLDFAQMALPAYMQGAGLGFYDKSEIRLALYMMVAFTAVFGILFVRGTALYASSRHESVVLHPETAAFATVLYFAAAYIPPYVNFNLPHWFPFIMGATAIQNGVWPYFSGYDFNYGLLCLAFLSGWLALFGLSTLSLSTVIMASDLISGAGAYALIRRLTGSRPVALLATSYLVLQASDTLSVTSTFRAPIQIVLGSVFLYASLRDADHRFRNGLLFGITVLWNPIFGAFSVAGFLAAHGYRVFFAARDLRGGHLKAIFAMFAGIVLPLLVIWLYTGPSGSRLAAFYAGSGGNLFLLGYANLAQGFNFLAMAASVLVVLYLAAVLNRVGRQRKMTTRSLFVGASLVSAIPYVMYAIGRSDWSHHFAAYWALMPSMSLTAYGLLRLFSLRQGDLAVKRVPIRKRANLTPVVVAVAFLLLYPFNALIESIGGYTTANEPAKQGWYNNCAAGKGCNPETKPTLRNHLAQAARPLVTIDPRLATACREGTEIISENDTLIYYAGHCYSSTGMPSINLLTTRTEHERYVEHAAARAPILFDNTKSTYSSWRGDMLGDLKSRLLQRGLREWPACNQYTILSKTNPTQLVKKICG